MSQTAAVLSRHQKAALIAPAVEVLGWQLIELDSFDTDSLLTKARQACCQRCGHQHTFAVEQHFAKAQYCQWCNP